MANHCPCCIPAAIPGILTGAILALSRAIGETAPLVVLGMPLFLCHFYLKLFDMIYRIANANL